jgi:hypothetical protein
LEVFFALRLLALESLISRFWTTRIPEGLLLAGLKEQLLTAPKVGHMHAWLPHLVMVILLSVPEKHLVEFQKFDFGNAPELIAEKMEQNQSLWLEQNYELGSLFGRAREGTQEER